LGLLHITNGESANARLRELELPGSFLAWDDPLHHGPVPTGLSLHEMSQVRAGFIAENQWETLEKARARFNHRDLTLQQAAKTDEIVIWSSFELFDQLQLLQILNWFELYRAVVQMPSVVWVRDYMGSGDLDGDDLRSLFLERETISAPQQGTAADIWQAFSAPEPSALLAWFQRSLRDLPFMQRALHRLFEEYPSIGNGLSRTQQQILQVLEPGPLNAPDIFETSQALERRRFMGDYSFWVEFRQLLMAGDPPVRELDGQRPKFPPQVAPNSPEFHNQLFQITEQGQQLLEDKDQFQPSEERWIGGVRLDRQSRWRWDEKQQTLTQMAGI
jgi:hypothetical protein